MTTKEKLIQEIEQAPDAIIEAILSFLSDRQIKSDDLNVNSIQVEAHKPILQIAQELMADLPYEVIDQLPTDGAEQHDHYIYGTPKQS